MTEFTIDPRLLLQRRAAVAAMIEKLERSTASFCACSAKRSLSAR
jgi:hypothetical protein